MRALVAVNAALPKLTPSTTRAFKVEKLDQFEEIQ
jgi:hypothetical protein